MFFALKINKFYSPRIYILLLGGLFLSPSLVFALGSSSGKDAIGIIENLARNMASIRSGILGFLYFSGICFIIKSIYYLKVYGEARTMMATTSSMKPPLTWLLVGMVFIAFPHALTITMNTVFSHYDGILAYPEWAHAKPDFDFELFMNSIFSIIRVIGLVSFARGWFIIAQSAQGGGGHQATLSKGIIHIMAGIIGMNIVRSLNVIDNSING